LEDFWCLLHRNCQLCESQFHSLHGLKCALLLVTWQRTSAVEETWSQVC
jgi:hypothetical protein